MKHRALSHQMIFEYLRTNVTTWNFKLNIFKHEILENIVFNLKFQVATFVFENHKNFASCIAEVKSCWILKNI